MRLLAERVVANDMDRMLLDTERVVTRLVEVSTDYDEVDSQDLLAGKQAMERTGGSFDVLGHLRTNGVSQATIGAICESFASIEDGEKLLYPDALPYLERLEKQRIPNFILTYGTGTDWQLTKLRASGLSSRPYDITDQKFKGEYIASKPAAAGNYVFVLTSGELIVAQSVILVDDKADSFRGLPAGCSGYRIRRPDEEQLASQAGSIPSMVREIASLDELFRTE